VVGKYAEHRDAYKSIYEALSHGGLAHSASIRIQRVHSEAVEREGPERLLAGVDGILVPGGFGERGIEGKIQAIQYARTQGTPFFGICLGMQCAVVEFARHVCGLERANSMEFDPTTPHPVICLLDEQKKITDKGGTMRRGAYPAMLVPGTRAATAYGALAISERHRHRFEFNNAYREILTAHGLRIAGASPDGLLVEIIELPEHPWFVGVQFHPEFKSQPIRPHPLFAAFIGAALGHRKKTSETPAPAAVSRGR